MERCRHEAACPDVEDRRVVAIGRMNMGRIVLRLLEVHPNDYSAEPGNDGHGAPPVIRQYITIQ